ncbi:alpha/beta hydrolase domain-containing protein VTE7 [Beta vulgaris subsp. vulgaris]|uniref:alpha/beta hydrolase domain-containing protein VTE7 n=1 Tax=Beta vulgaris subsp. vulgaris TaxID=3555 RepID=UPI00254718E5|nr:alpha/beta hydrolase domain-containing protein VTE7 [Beta vulgaris subsp. vulgaris]
MQALTVTPSSYSTMQHLKNFKNTRKCFKVTSNHEFPSFLPKQIHKIKDPFARNLAIRIEQLPVQVSFSDACIMSSCIRPSVQGKTSPVVLLHGFDSSCLEWRCVYPLLEEAGTESWAVDILGWGFSNLEQLPSCDVASKRDHLYQFWRLYIKRPMILVGPSLGAAVAVDFAVNHPEAVSRLVLIDASVYSEGIGGLAQLPVIIANAGLALLKSIPLRLFVNKLVFKNITVRTSLDWMNIGRLHCLFPWWRDATLSFMASGGYKVTSMIKQVKQRALIIWGEDDQIISYKLAHRLHSELQDAILRPIPDCGHVPHVEKPSIVANLILKFVQDDCY